MTVLNLCTVRVLYSYGTTRCNPPPTLSLQVHGGGAGPERHHPRDACGGHHARSVPPAGGAQRRALPAGPAEPREH